MRRTHNNPEATAEALAGGWLHTGDIGVLDERWGEVPMLVVPSLEGIDIPAVKAAVTADYRRPRWLTGFGAPPPRTLGAKIVKREIRSHFPAVPAGAASLR